MRIWGREPAAWIGLIEAALALLIVFPLGLSAGMAGLIMAVVVAVFAVITAISTSEPILAAIVGLVKAGAALGVAFGWELSAEQTGALIGAITVVVGFFQRTQVSPTPVSVGTRKAATP